MDETQPDKLHEAAKATWLRKGRDPQAFEREWPKIRERLLAQQAQMNEAQQAIRRRWRD
jgi:hypothetical protein